MISDIYTVKSRTDDQICSMRQYMTNTYIYLALSSMYVYVLDCVWICLLDYIIVLLILYFTTLKTLFTFFRFIRLTQKSA